MNLKRVIKWIGYIVGYNSSALYTHIGSIDIFLGKW